jgi:hypothetical protein
MSPEGKVQVRVKSRRVPVRTVEVLEPLFSPSGVFMGTRRSKLVLYDNALNQEHQRAIDEGRRLSCHLGFELEVVDSSRSGFFRRMLSSLGRGASESPALMVAPGPSQS